MRSRKRKGSPISLFAFQDIIMSVTGIILLVTIMLALELMHRTEQAPQAQTELTAEAIEDAVAANRQEIQRLKAELQGEDELLQYDVRTLATKLEEVKLVNELIARSVQEGEQRRDEADRRREQAQQALAQTVSPSEIEQQQQKLEQMRRELEELQRSNRIIFNRPSDDSKAPWLIELAGDTSQVAEVGVSRPPRVFADPAGATQWAAGQNTGSMYFVILVKPSGLPQFARLKEQLEQLGFDIGFDLLSEQVDAIDPRTGAGTP